MSSQGADLTGLPPVQPPRPASGWSPEQDLEHLRLLSIFHYLVAALVALFALFPVIHLVAGFAALASSVSSPPEDAFPGLFVGGFFILFAGTWILLGTAMAVCLLLAGRYLSEQTHYTFCLVTAGIACAFMPLGTVLGVFTLLVLLRPSVRARFEG